MRKIHAIIFFHCYTALYQSRDVLPDTMCVDHFCLCFAGVYGT